MAAGSPHRSRQLLARSHTTVHSFTKPEGPCVQVQHRTAAQSPTHRRVLAVATLDVMRVPWVMLLVIACGRATAHSTPDLADGPMDAGSTGSGPTGDAGFSDAGVDEGVLTDAG